MSVTIPQMQGAIEQFWAAVYSKNIAAVSALISTDLKATYQVTYNGTKLPEKQLSYQEYIDTIRDLFASFQYAKTTQRDYDPGTFKLSSDGTAVWTVNFFQNLELATGAMNSTGAQTWTFNGTQFVALSVIEFDTNLQTQRVNCAVV